MQKYAAELIGTFVLVFIGAGAVIANAITGGELTLLGVALAHGLALMAMAYVFGNISGTHINPAVTLALVASKKMKPKEGLYYIASQLTGSILAGAALFVVFPKAPLSISLGTTLLNQSFGVTSSVGILVEAILTFLLALTVFALVFDKRNQTPLAGFAVGMVLSFSIMVGGPLTGGALNPARAFGPAVISEFISSMTGIQSAFGSAFSMEFFYTQLVYWIGPIAGAVLAAALYSSVFLKEKKKK